MVLDRNGELFSVKDKKALKYIKDYGDSENYALEYRTVFRKAKNIIGFESSRLDEKNVYLDEAGNRIKREIAEASEAELYEQLSPLFSYIELLPGTDNLLVSGDFGRGIIKWEGGRQ